MVSATHIQVSSLLVVYLPLYKLLVIPLPIKHVYIFSLPIWIRPSYMGMGSIGYLLSPPRYSGTLILLVAYINPLGYTCVYSISNMTLLAVQWIFTIDWWQYL